MKLNISYIAGFIDGEGCISIQARHGLRLIVTNTRLDLLEAINEHFGETGRIKEKVRVASDGATRTCWQLVFWSRRAESVLAELRPHLILKAREADLALEFSSLIGRIGAGPGTYGNNPLPPEMWARRAELEMLCKAAKRR